MNKKSHLRVVVMEDMKMFTKCLHLYYTSGDTTLSPISPNSSLIIVSGCDCGVPRVDRQTIL